MGTGHARRSVANLVTERININPPTQTADRATLALINTLQSSLELDKLIETFARELSAHVPHDSIEYRNPAAGVIQRLGNPEGFSCNYRITLLEESLGDLQLTRKTMFSADELAHLESLLCAVVYPLRNALLYKRALQSAFTDPVTGTHNRAAFDNALQREVELAQRHGTQLSLVMVDADHFKRINDTYGHIVGDSVLRGLGDCLLKSARGCDMVFRYGGEEFAVVLSNTRGDGALRLAERIRSTVEAKRFQYEETVLSLTVSVGVASLTLNDDAAALIERADRALYQAKHAGRNRVVSETGEPEQAD
jgi:diguanylate cyclase (GGDEF)-like protein